MSKALVIVALAAATLAPFASASPGNAHAHLSIPRLHLRAAVTDDLAAGPAWWPVTGRPGGGDTVAIAGHRTTHTRPFTYLNRLRRGDWIYLQYQGRQYAYRVTGHRVVSVDDLHIADAVGHERLLLTACARADGTPTSASWRIVVYALPAKRAIL